MKHLVSILGFSLCTILILPTSGNAQVSQQEQMPLQVAGLFQNIGNMLGVGNCSLSDINSGNCNKTTTPASKSTVPAAPAVAPAPTPAPLTTNSPPASPPPVVKSAAQIKLEENVKRSNQIQSDIKEYQSYKINGKTLEQNKVDLLNLTNSKNATQSQIDITKQRINTYSSNPTLPQNMSIMTNETSNLSALQINLTNINAQINSLQSIISDQQKALSKFDAKTLDKLHQDAQSLVNENKASIRNIPASRKDSTKFKQINSQ